MPPTADRCECDYAPFHHGQPCPNRPMDHGPDIRTSPELCGPCLFGCEDEDPS